MALRSRLIVAFLLLSVVPLSAVTFVTYRTWVNTFENAARREAAQSAIDIGRRMERITSDVGRRMDRMLVETRGASGTGSIKSAAGVTCSLSAGRGCSRPNRRDRNPGVLSSSLLGMPGAVRSLRPPR